MEMNTPRQTPPHRVVNLAPSQLVKPHIYLILKKLVVSSLCSHAPYLINYIVGIRPELQLEIFVNMLIEAKFHLNS